MPEFIPGLKLCEMFFNEAVNPILAEFFPGLAFSAGNLDFGSDVLGFDTPMSRDHHWGPRVMLFLSPPDLDVYSGQIKEVLSNNLPSEFYGYSTHFSNLQTDSGVMVAHEGGPVNHYVQITTPQKFFMDHAGIDINQPVKTVDWLLAPRQRLKTIRSGKVFHDGLNVLERVREELYWYPHDLWLYLLANQWRHVDQEEPFVGRCGDTADETGSALVAARLVHNLMNLCFLMEREYAPYSKWFGTAFSRLDCAAELQPILDEILQSKTWKEREKHLSQAYLFMCRMHNRLGITEDMEPEISLFHKRPYQVPHSSRFVNALRKEIQSEEILSLPEYVGSIDQFVFSIDVLESTRICRSFSCLFKNPKEEEL